VSIFDRFENAVEKGINGAFSRVFRSGLKPVDVTTAIRRAIEDNLQEFAADRTIAPNSFALHISPSDFDALAEDLDVLRDEFERQTTQYAAEHDYVLLGPVEVLFERDDAELTGQVEVECATKRGAAAPATAVAASPEHPIIDIDGEKWLLTEPVTVIGRGSEADIVVPDSGVSRRHLELRVTPTGVIATDLGSTNGTFVEGHRIDAATLVDGNQIVIGRTRILFWTHPASDPTQDR
jgi:hypothetical protein